MVADMRNDAVRRVKMEWAVSTVAGNGEAVQAGAARAPRVF